MALNNHSQQLQAKVLEVIDSKAQLHLVAGNTKHFYGNKVSGETLDLSENTGIIDYEPTELVITALCGTPVAEIESTLAEQGQMLAFEPPHFNGKATLGGTLATGMAGPARPWGGAPRDSLLGIKLLDGKGQILTFGGQVMKNVAGYDVSRLMTRTHGSLGILLECSLKIIPAHAQVQTQCLELPRDTAVKMMRDLFRQPVPIRGAAYYNNRLYIRLSGNQSSVASWVKKLGGETVDNDFWRQLRDHQLDFFNKGKPLWRLSLTANAPALACEDDCLTDWAGSQRWCYSESSAEVVRQQVAQHNGHAEAVYNHTDLSARLQPLDALNKQLHENLKDQFDPHNLFNNGAIALD